MVCSNIRPRLRMCDHCRSTQCDRYSHAAQAQDDGKLHALDRSRLHQSGIYQLHFDTFHRQMLERRQCGCWSHVRNRTAMNLADHNKLPRFGKDYWRTRLHPRRNFHPNKFD